MRTTGRVCGEKLGYGEALETMLVTQRGREARMKPFARKLLYPSSALSEDIYVF